MQLKKEHSCYIFPLAVALEEKWLECPKQN